jgi:hypothetical protein
MSDLLTLWSLKLTYSSYLAGNRLMLFCLLSESCGTHTHTHSVGRACSYRRALFMGSRRWTVRTANWHLTGAPFCYCTTTWRISLASVLTSVSTVRPSKSLQLDHDHFLPHPFQLIIVFSCIPCGELFQHRSPCPSRRHMFYTGKRARHIGDICPSRLCHDVRWHPKHMHNMVSH